MSAAVAPAPDLFGVPIAAVTMEQALARVEDAIARREPLHIGVVNVAKLVNMRRESKLREAVLASDVIFADGMGVVWASRLLGQPLPERVTGIDLMLGMFERGSRRGYRIYCLGATEAVLARAVRTLTEAYPGVQIVGAHHGYFTQDEEPAIAATVAATRPDILLVAMTSPRKEEFLARWNHVMGATVCHGVGGSFDVVAGEVERAPASWQRLGLEWLYRVRQEPRRLWRRYLVTNTIFIGLVCLEAARRATARTPVSNAS
jgi:N-acetylglucosaminyldiphosphoundecaprenol N-acetyl-beta-D-mannosaminyltransferase